MSYLKKYLQEIQEYEERDRLIKEKYDYETEQLEKMFPNAKFTVCISLSELDDVLSFADKILIKVDNDCCDDEYQRDIDWIFVQNKSGNGITKRDAIQSMIDYGVYNECGHRFLELFEETCKCVFVPRFAS